ncbi:MAG: phenylalanine--tRNA ligase subunit alpha [Dehalococcoidales bacterium]|nr:phenylalanine--tRNA ligase subunit alpha [Dehalococcoidales bacterium]
MREQLEQLAENARRELEAIDSATDMESWRVRYLGRKSDLTGILRGLAGLPLEERKAIGARANEIKSILGEHFARKTQALKQEAARASLRVDDTLLARGDVTLPGRPVPAGRLHPITQTLHEVCDIFAAMGFDVVEGPEVEWDYYNFEALNIPEEHPSRDTYSSFWVDYRNEAGKYPMILTTQTTAISARVVERMRPPIRVVEPGKVYRYEATDATHLRMFVNFDGLAVDKGITMADLKGTLYEFSRRYFGGDRRVRFRCDFFPFVEPGVEVAIECSICHGEGCRYCRNEGWLEILGAGMTHPRVLERGGIDPEVYTSFAFGIGLERLHMLRYGIDDIRLFYNNDLRFLRQF